MQTGKGIFKGYVPKKRKYTGDPAKGVFNTGLSAAAAKRLDAEPEKKKPSKFRKGLSRALEAAGAAITANVGRVPPGQEWKAGILKGVAGMGLAAAARRKAEGDITAAERGLGAKKELATHRAGFATDLEKERQKGRKELLRETSAAKNSAYARAGRLKLSESQRGAFWSKAGASAKDKFGSYKWSKMSANVQEFHQLSEFNKSLEAAEGRLKKAPKYKTVTRD